MTLSICFLDVETTGLDPMLHEIIELGVVLCCGPEFAVVTEWSMKIRPLHIATAEPKALEINGYTPEGWAAAVPLREALKRLDRLCAGEDRVMLAGHNLQQFDLVFLRAAYAAERLAFPPVDYRHLDTMSLAFPLYATGRTSGLSLDAVCQALGITRPSPHGALADARAAYLVAMALVGAFGGKA